MDDQALDNLFHYCRTVTIFELYIINLLCSDENAIRYGILCGWLVGGFVMKCIKYEHFIKQNGAGLVGFFLVQSYIVIDVHQLFLGCVAQHSSEEIRETLLSG